MSSPGEGKSKHVCESSRAESREEKAKRMILRRSWPIAFAARSVGSDLSRETSLTTNYLNFGSVWVMCMRGLGSDVPGLGSSGDDDHGGGLATSLCRSSLIRQSTQKHRPSAGFQSAASSLPESTAQIAGHPEYRQVPYP